MSEIKKMDLSGYDSSDSEKKGSLNVPYSIVEYEDAIKKIIGEEDMSQVSDI